MTSGSVLKGQNFIPVIEFINLRVDQSYVGILLTGKPPPKTESCVPLKTKMAENL